MKNLLCKLGLHWPMMGHVWCFHDWVSGEPVYDCHCPCGRIWMVANKEKYPTFKVETNFKTEDAYEYQEQDQY